MCTVWGSVNMSSFVCQASACSVEDLQQQLSRLSASATFIRVKPRSKVLREPGPLALFPFLGVTLEAGGRTSDAPNRGS